MKTESSLRALRLLSVATFVSLLGSCALPPREAMRIVQRNGLIPYLSGSYGGYSGSGAYASAAPFQTNNTPFVRPRPVSPVPYRSTYETNRYSQAEYNRVPYRPKTVTSRSSTRSSNSRRSSDAARPSATRHTPEIADTPEKAPVKTPAKPADTTTAAPKKVATETLPYGTPVAGRPGMVTSPFAQKQQLVDVTGMASGDTVKDPYSGKLFRVPPTQQAAAPKTTPEAPPAAEKPAAAAPSAPAEPKP
ncbi:MAG: hypothetical protein ABL974_15740 [Prosthecobacter sp.]